MDGPPPELKVRWSKAAHDDLLALEAAPPDLPELIDQVLAQDPRPAYQNDPLRCYGVEFYDLDVRFRVSGGEALVLEIHRFPRTKVGVHLSETGSISTGEHLLMNTRVKTTILAFSLVSLLASSFADAARMGSRRSHGMRRAAPTQTYQAPVQQQAMPAAAAQQRKSGPGVGTAVAAGVAGAAAGYMTG